MAGCEEIEGFVARWAESRGRERGNYQLFLIEFCDLMGVARPSGVGVDYCFEKSVQITHPDGKVTTNFIDLYKRGHFVLEAKQGSQTGDVALGTARRGTAQWDRAMRGAFGQALKYAAYLSDGKPPFLITCDVGHVFEVWSGFSGDYGGYGARRTIPLTDLAKPDVLDFFRAIFTDPASLDPSLRAARVTREVAGHLADLARDLEKRHNPQVVAHFLMLCLFTMFAEDIGLLPNHLFQEALQERWIPTPKRFPLEVVHLWNAMDKGGPFGFEPRLLQFNGGLFTATTALELTASQLGALLEAARCDWSAVEPAIFGTLVERALDPVERHRLGAHFTPREYIERLVRPTVIEPLRAEWYLAQAEARVLLDKGEEKPTAKDRQAAAKVLHSFHARLCSTRVLDPACGSGNFLYVTFDLMKEIESEVLRELADLQGEQERLEMQGATVNPGQFLGIERNPRAREVADLVLWIGYLQWHRRTRGDVKPAEPVLHEYKNIVCRDAVLVWEREELRQDGAGKPLTRWDGRTHMRDPITGEDVPDPSARVSLVQYINPQRPEWPDADYIVGNPPFVGTRRMRLTLGDGYVDALVEASPQVARNADYVMYWWDHAAELVRDGRVRRFGFITTNSITQTFNRAILRDHLQAKNGLSLTFAIPDHPWVDSEDGAAVRVAMTVGVRGPAMGVRYEVVEEQSTAGDEVAVKLGLPHRGTIAEDLRAGASPAAASPLQANRRVAFWGVKFYGDGFIVTQEEAERFAAAQDGRSLARPFISGKDLTAKPRGLYALDCNGLDEGTLARDYPASYQRLLERVKPVRAHNPRAFKRDRWWIFGENQPGMRQAISGLSRYIATVETAKHRVFQFFDRAVLAEGTVATIALEDAFFLGVLSSRFHVTWALAAGGRLGVGNDPRYNKNRCFEPFPFPAPTDEQQVRIRELAERLDAHRKKVQATHADATTTAMYNALQRRREALQSGGQLLADKERSFQERTLIGVLAALHDELDAVVAEAYGWPSDLDDEVILERLVALNAERATEEARGQVRWLRPALQRPEVAQPVQFLEADQEDLPETTADDVVVAALLWPKQTPQQIKAVRDLLTQRQGAWTVEEIARGFVRARRDAVLKQLDALEMLGLLVSYDDGTQKRWSARSLNP